MLGVQVTQLASCAVEIVVAIQTIAV